MLFPSRAKRFHACEAGNSPACGFHPFRKERLSLKKPILTRIGFFWWERVDSNHRSEAQQIYSLPPLATRELSPMSSLCKRYVKLLVQASGAGERTRTPDLLITNQLLYQLSYTSTGAAFWRQEKQLFPFPRAARPIERPDSLIIIPCAAGKVKMISKKISLFFSRRGRGGAREKFPKKQWTFFYFVLQ